MAGVIIRGGAEVDIPTPAEIRAIIGEEQRAAYRGVKYGRMPVLSGTASGGSLSIGGHAAADIIGPEMGYAWVIRHLWVSGLTASSTAPDIVNLLVNNQTWWQFNGNNFAYVFGPGELVLQQGEAWALQSSGTFAATGTIRLGGAFWSVPGEMLAKLVAG